MKIYDNNKYEAYKKFIRFYETNQEIEKYKSSYIEKYKFIGQMIYGALNIVGQNHNSGRSSYDYMQFELEKEIVDLIYEKYKPMVEDFECWLKEKKLKDLETNLKNTKRAIENAKKDLCK